MEDMVKIVFFLLSSFFLPKYSYFAGKINDFKRNGNMAFWSYVFSFDGVINK